ncbi:MAG: D-glycerate dehydrogenase [Hyphomonas sp.]|nr:D-glycerate dehydrogenase [Hyphomonas sp.]
MKHVIVTQDLPADVLQATAARFQVSQISLKALGPEAFLKQIGEPDALIVSPGDPVNAALIAELPESVRVISSYSVGLDHVDLAAAEARGITVTNTPDVLTDATADVALLLILGALRGAAEAFRMISEDRWTGWQPAQVFGRDVTGKRLGIYGAGRIGLATVKRAQAFGMPVHYWSGRSRSADFDAIGAEPVSDMDAFLSRCDVLSLHCPSTPTTRGLVNAALIEKLPPRAVLINTGRGDLVVDGDVIAALKSCRLGAVGLDVFNGEPDIDPRYRTLSNAFVLPHIGSATEETRLAMGKVLLANLHDALSGT